MVLVGQDNFAEWQRKGGPPETTVTPTPCGGLDGTRQWG
jgi:hypothetical protein